jgi:hypothetical protein
MDGTSLTANVIASETFRNVSVTPTAARFVQTVLAAESSICA